MYVAPLQQAIAQTTTTATKTTNSKAFLTYENSSTLGVKIQYPANWQRIESEDDAHGVLFLSPSESTSDRFWKVLAYPATSFLTVIIIR